MAASKPRPLLPVRLGLGHTLSRIGVAVLLRKADNRWELEDDRLIPRLFYPLPLVETHDLGVPFVMVSHKFEPTSERNGVYARAPGGTEDGSATNWALLRDAPALYKKLAALCSSEHWQAPHNLVRVGKPPLNKQWLDPKLFASEVVLKILDFIRGGEAPGFVLTQENGLVPVSKSMIPIKDPDGKLYSLASRLVPVKDLLPKSEIAEEWTAIVDGWAGLLGKGAEQLGESLTAECLGSRVADCKTLDQLGAILVPEAGGDGLAWLNELLGSVPKEGLQSFLHSRAVLPSQKGDLKRENELRLDDSIHETVKGVCEKLGDEVRSELLHVAIYAPVRQLFETAKGRALSNEDCIERALKRIKEPAVEGKEETYSDANATLLRWLVDHEREDKLAGYTVLCASGRGELRSEKALLVPASLWKEGAKEFADVFSDARRMNEKYAALLKDWRVKRSWVADGPQGVSFSLASAALRASPIH